MPTTNGTTTTKITVRKNGQDAESRIIKVAPVAGVPATEWMSLGYAIDGSQARKVVPLANLLEEEQSLANALDQFERTIEFA